MRDPKRIPIVLNLIFHNDEILDNFLGVSSSKLRENIYDNWEEIENKWNDNPDLRFGQLLCNLRLIPSMDIENKIWNIEENDWLIKNNYLDER